MRVRIKDVAALAGVSTATVSLALNDVEGSRIATSTRDRVRAAAKELGYTPNNLARGLRTQRTHTIGFVGDRVATTPYAVQMILGAQEAAWERDNVLMLVSTGGDPTLEAAALQALLDRQVDGLLYTTMYHRRVALPEGALGTPLVLLDAEAPDVPVTSVVPDEERGGYSATRLLIEAGHRRIGHLRNVDDVPATGLREQGYRRALAEAGLEFDQSIVVRTSDASERAAKAATELLDRDDRPTAIFAFNDRMAMGVYRAARRLGLDVPGDLSVVGFDDQELVAAELEPGLTTVALPHRAMGRWAAQRLIEMITDPDSHPTPEARLEPCPVVERGSVGPPPPLGRRRTNP